MDISPSVLARPRVRAFFALAACVLTWFIVAPYLSPLHVWPAILLVSIVVMPATLLLVLLALPLSTARWLIPGFVALALLAVGSTVLAPNISQGVPNAVELRLPPDDRAAVDAALNGERPPKIGAYVGAARSSEPASDVKSGWLLVANFAKLWAAVFAGWAFLRLFEQLSWVVLVALVIPAVDAFSVWRGPTKAITAHHFEVYTAVAIAFLVPGGGAAYLGPPDVLFFALFLAAAVRWGLRPGWTWLSMTFMYGFTVMLAYALDVAGLPALPFLSFGFLLPNVDLLWRQFVSRKPAGSPKASSSS